MTVTSDNNMADNMGRPEPRIDGRLKVTGAARYPSDVSVTRPAYAFLVTSTIAKGKITRLDTSGALNIPGVLDVLTHENVGSEVQSAGFFAAGGAMSTSILPLMTSTIQHEGQIIAIVLAETFELAREGAYRINVVY